MDPQTQPPSANPANSTNQSTDSVSAPLPEPTQTPVRQQAIGKLSNSNNVLVTVGLNPSVDELSSALGLTLLLDKLGKHATTVFSGEIPRAIEFLDPEATFEDNVDSLRDFIIALDKEKADKLRYKVEEDVVRIFITPYKTKISEDDLNFSQGDFNVDVIVALGVVAREDLDKAITAHGRILHDATVVTVNAGTKTSNLGEINWNDPNASSIAEMLVSGGEAFGSGLLDAQISTAYLTGVVAATNRFSNEKTSPKVMTIAAQLMAAGANQQLIASNLRQDGLLSDSVREPSKDHAKESEVVVEHEDKESSKSSVKHSKKTKNTKNIDLNKSDKEGSLPRPSEFPPKTKDEPISAPAEEASIELPDDLKAQLEPALNSDKSDDSNESIKDVKINNSPEAESDSLPGKAEPANDEPDFNATMAQPLPSAEDKLAESTEVKVPSTVQPDLPTLPNNPSPEPTVVNNPPEVDAEVQQDDNNSASNEDAIEEARRAVESAVESQPFDPAGQPLQSLGAQQLPSLRDDTPVVSDSITPETDPQISTPTDHSLLPSPELPSEPSMVDPSLETSESTTDLPSVPSPDQSFMSGEVAEPEASPMDSFMSAHTSPPLTPSSPQETPSTNENQALSSTEQNDQLPPPPPLPTPNTTDGTLPPLPPFPNEQNNLNQQSEPSTQPDFMKDVSVSQNPITQAGEDLATKKAEADQNRQAKLDQISQQYDAAVDKNLENRSLPPVNDDHTNFPMPPTLSK